MAARALSGDAVLLADFHAAMQQMRGCIAGAAWTGGLTSALLILT